MGYLLVDDDSDNGTQMSYFSQCAISTFSTIVFSEHKAIVLLDFELKNLGRTDTHYWSYILIPFFNCNIYAMPL